MKSLFRMFVLTAFLPCASASAQDADTRVGTIEQAQAEKATTLHPFVPNKAEEVTNRVFEMMLDGGLRWHPYFTSPYAGGGFVMGAGYNQYVSPFNTLDLRGSITISGYKMAEAAFLAPRVFDRRGTLTVVGGWREATQVAFYNFSSEGQPEESRANYSFQQPYASALLEVRPTRGMFLLRGGVEATQWKSGPSTKGEEPSVETIYTPATLPGLGAQPTYLHSQGTVAIDSRDAPGYARRGTLLSVTVHDFADTQSQYGFDQLDYEATEHIPLGRDAWVVSLHAMAQTTYDKSGQQIPFFMMPALGGGSDLRGYASWRFRDQNTLLLQGEWRVLVSRIFDLALFYDAGKATVRRSELDFKNLTSDYGVGFRLHGPGQTPLRVELAKGNEGVTFVLAASHAF
jgi:surface antigen Omp85-like protein